MRTCILPRTYRDSQLRLVRPRADRGCIASFRFVIGNVQKQPVPVIIIVMSLCTLPHQNHNHPLFAWDKLEIQHSPKQTPRADEAPGADA